MLTTRHNKLNAKELPKLFPVEQHFTEALLFFNEKTIETDGCMRHLTSSFTDAHSQFRVDNKHHLVRRTITEIFLHDILLL